MKLIYIGLVILLFSGCISHGHRSDYMDADESYAIISDAMNRVIGKINDDSSRMVLFSVSEEDFRKKIVENSAGKLDLLRKEDLIFDESNYSYKANQGRLVYMWNASSFEIKPERDQLIVWIAGGFTGSTYEVYNVIYKKNKMNVWDFVSLELVGMS